MEEKPSLGAPLFEREEVENGSNGVGENDGWKTVVYTKKKKKSQLAEQTTDLNLEKPRSVANSNSDGSNVFRSLEEHAEERIRLRILQESQKAEAEAEADAATRSKPIPAASDEEDGVDSDAEAAGGVGSKVEVKKPKQKKPKKPKITVTEAASKIDAADLASFLLDISTSYEEKQDILLMRFADYFARAFSSVGASQFPWAKMLKESTVEKMIDIPLCHISEAVYRTSVDWISQRSGEALAQFTLWSLDGILADLANQTSVLKNSKNLAQQSSSKSQVAMFVVLAMVLRQKPDVLISLLPSLRDDPKYQGQDKFPLIVWVFCQASLGDLVVGMYSWIRNLLPVISGKSISNPQTRDLVLQLVERILSAPKAKPILLNGAVRKGDRLVPPSALELLIRVTFPAPSSRIKATERFEAVYPTLKELALAGSPGTKATKQVSQQLLPVAVSAMNENNPELSKEAAAIFIWCLSQNADCFKQWEKLYMDNIEASVTVLQTLAGQSKEHSIKLSPDAMKGMLKNIRLKNAQELAEGADASRQASIRDADKYCKLILRRSSRRLGCVTSGLFVVTATIAVGAFLLSPNVESWDWQNLKVLLSTTVLNLK